MTVATIDHVAKFGLERLDQPSYSPDLAPNIKNVYKEKIKVIYNEARDYSQFTGFINVPSMVT